MSMNRRSVVKAVAAGGALMGLSVLMPRAAMAAWTKAAFEASEQSAAIKALYGEDSATESPEVILDAPDIAENGAVVPVSVSTTLPNVESMSIFIENNPSPLAVQFMIPEGTEADVSTRVRMGKTTNVTAVVKADGVLHRATKEVKVTIGGCGG
ncbi:thiosulfate oxidation carrier protein SoxY [Marinobacterium sp. AK62]|uniref:Thiosulfate oxidation carrier protein SoxY n=1 Tax=Marinobacterium alkalitolerans TaxID=1542925 RepID=A0ABS3ZEA2_9GAMM|nr:thiosulfate oxidation carrier protein SoxY [Marinobacterium alkalitolerans]MBP0050004.1 thiosulfate oxidation carrier protein SoxY [Marinobacterium alkalitolerans]